MNIIIGQEAVCPDGLGRVIGVRHGICEKIHIRVKTYVNNSGCEWDSHNVKLINPLENEDIAKLSPDALTDIKFLLHQLKLQDSHQNAELIEELNEKYND